MTTEAIRATQQKKRFDPVRLLELSLDNGVFRFCNMGAASYEGELWRGGFEGGGTKEQNGGGIICTAKIWDKKGEMHDEFRTRRAQRCTARMWEGNGTDFVLRFHGIISGYKMQAGEIKLNMLSALNTVIDVKVSNPFVSYWTPAGTIITVGGETLIIERAD